LCKLLTKYAIQESRFTSGNTADETKFSVFSEGSHLLRVIV
jgi:hypothetical protein